MTEEGVDIPPINSVAKVSRLPFRVVDLLPILIIGFLGWQLFVAPQLAKKAPPLAPALRAPALDGGIVDLQAYRGRVVFIDFFATWCEPCQQATPILEHFAATHPEVQVISVDVGENRATVAAFARAHKLAAPVRIALDRTLEMNDRWHIQGYPTIIGIDPAGVEQDRYYGFNPLLNAVLIDAERRYLAARRDAKKAAMASRDS